MSSTVIPAMRNLNSQVQDTKSGKASVSVEVTRVSASVTVAQSQSVLKQDTYTSSKTGGQPPMESEPSYGYGRYVGRKPAHGENGNRHGVVGRGGESLKELFQNQRNPGLSTGEAYHKIEITITKIQISISGSASSEPAYKTRELGTACSVSSILEQEKGQEFYAKIKEVQESFRNVGRLWEANTADRTDSAALQQLDDARIAWVTELRESDPAGFRAWLQIHVGPHALNGNFDNCVKPEDFTLEDYNAWMCKGFTDYESGTLPKAEDILGMEMPKETAKAPEQVVQTEETAGPTHKALVDNHNGHRGASSLTSAEKEYLYDLFERSYDNNDSAYNNHRVVLDAITTRREGESNEDFEVRWISSLGLFIDWAHSQIGERKIMPDAIDHLQNRKPLVAKQKEGESDDAFMRRKIAWDTDNAWQEHLLKTLLTTEGWPMGEALRYQKEKGVEWVTDLMKNNPAMFRDWLGIRVANDVEQGWYDKNGNFTVATVPKDFTVSDYNEWMSKDVLDYL